MGQCFDLRPSTTFGFGSGSRLGSYRAYPILVVGDDITTDHISPAGQVPKDRKQPHID